MIGHNPIHGFMRNICLINLFLKELLVILRGYIILVQFDCRTKKR